MWVWLKKWWLVPGHELKIVKLVTWCPEWSFLNIPMIFRIWLVAPMPMKRLARINGDYPLICWMDKTEYFELQLVDPSIYHKPLLNLGTKPLGQVSNLAIYPVDIPHSTTYYYYHLNFLAESQWFTKLNIKTRAVWGSDFPNPIPVTGRHAVRISQGTAPCDHHFRNIQVVAVAQVTMGFKMFQVVKSWSSIFSLGDDWGT